MAILELAIRNLALIDELNLTLKNGLSAITGETGSGKSLVMAALTMLSGGKTDKDIIRTGSSKCSVSAIFGVADSKRAIDALAEKGYAADDGEIVLSREINANGRNVCKIAGDIVPLAAYKQIASRLIDMHGQHATQELLTDRTHLSFIDAYANGTNAAHTRLTQDTRGAYESYLETSRALSSLTSDIMQRSKRIDMLTYQLNEIKGAKLVRGEEEKLQERAKLSRNAEKIATALRKASTLVAGGGRVSGALNDLRQSAGLLESIGAFGAAYQSLGERIAALTYELEDVSRELDDRLAEVEIDPVEIDKVESRLDQIGKLGKKYGATIDDMLEYAKEIEEELRALERYEETTEELRLKLDKNTKEYKAVAAKLSESRREAAKGFETLVVSHLRDMSMEHSRFSVEFADGDDAFSPSGFDKPRFIFSANVGEPMKPLADVASGGELSRVMLAIKTILAGSMNVPTIVFDEIDTGISGRTAQSVAEKMLSISRNAQVICVTHLPQIAAMAGNSYVVEKEASGGKTSTRLVEVSGDARTAELARLVGGSGSRGTNHGDALQYARRLIEAADARKLELGD